MALFAREDAVERRRNLKGRRAGRVEPIDLAVRPNTGLPVVAEQAASAATARGVGTGVVKGKNIRANSITANHITAGSINAGHITAGSINAGHITAGSINAGHITAGSITAGHIQARSITADRIVVGSLTADEIQARSITADRIVALSITANEIAAGAITAGKIAAGAIDSGSIAAGAITAGMIAGGSITGYIIDIAGGGQLRARDGANKVRATMDGSGFTVYGPDGVSVWMSPSNGVQNPGIAPDAIGGVQIQVGAVTESKILAGSINAGHIQAGAITAGHIQSARLDSISIYGGTIANSDTNPSYVLDSGGLGIAAIIDSFQPKALKFAGSGGIEVGSISYLSGVNEMFISSLGGVEIGAGGGNILLNPLSSVVLTPGSKVRLRNVLGFTDADVVMEGAQFGLRVGVRWMPTTASEWHGAGVMFRYRRVDGAGNAAAPSSVSIAAEYTRTNIALAGSEPMVVIDNITATGCFYHVQAAAIANARHDIALVTN